MSETFGFVCMASPVGRLKLVASAHGLAAVLWENDALGRVPFCAQATPRKNCPILLEAQRQLEQYFAGERQTFDVALQWFGSEFQQRVWRALLGIPYGQTRSYGQLARGLGAAGAARAVGSANGKNPLSIVIPCHRVIGSQQQLTGFAGGLQAKRYLLRLEAQRVGALSGDLFAPRALAMANGS